MEGKDTGFNIHGRKRTQKEVEREIARNVTLTSQLQLMQDIPTPEGVEVFTPGAGVSCTPVTSRKVCTSNLPSVQLQRQIHVLMYNNHQITKSNLFRKMDLEQPQFLRMLNTSVPSSGQLSFCNSPLSEANSLQIALGDVVNNAMRSISILRGSISLTSYFPPEDPDNAWITVSYGLEGLVTQSKLLQSFIGLTNRGAIGGSQLESGINGIIIILGESFLIDLLSGETITTRIFMRKILPAVVAVGSIKVTKYILEGCIDILNLTSCRHSYWGCTEQEVCMSTAVRNGDSRMVELLCTAGFSLRILDRKRLPIADRKLLWNAGNINALQTLLTFGAHSECFIIGTPQGYPLIDAAKSGSLEAVNILLRHGSRVNFYVKRHFGTALQAAVWAQDLEMAKFLIACGADVNAPFGTQYQLAADDLSDHDQRLSLMTPIQIACAKNNVPLAELLLNRGANVNLSSLIQLDYKGSEDYLGFCHGKYSCTAYECMHLGDIRHLTALQNCVQNGNINLVRLLLSNKADPNFRAIPDWEDTPLQLSIRLEYLDIARVLMEFGADVNASPRKLNGRTALQAAAEIGDIQIVQELLMRNADINSPPGYIEGLTAFQAAKKMGHHLMAEFLCISGANTFAPPSLLSAATEMGDLDLINNLVRQGADIKNTTAGTEATLNAIFHQNLPMLKLLVEHGAPINLENNGGKPPIIASVMEDWLDGVRWLLNNVADINFNSYSYIPTHDRNVSAFSWSTIKNNFNMVDLLLTRGASLHCHSTENRYHDPLCLALHSGCPAVIIYKLINEYAKTDPFILDQEVLAFAVCNEYNDSDHLRTVTLLNVMSKLPKTQYVAQVMNAWNRLSENDDWIHGFDEKNAESKKKVIRLLLKAGANVNSRHPSGSFTLLQKFIQVNRIKMAKFLIKKGAEIEVPASRNTGTPLQEAIKNDEIDFTHFLLERGADINAPPAESYGATALQEATKNGNRRLISILLERGAEVDAPPAEDGGVTALQAAAINGDIDIAIGLIEHGARVAAPGAPKNGRTAIDGAAERGNEDMLQLLLNHYDGCEDLSVVCGRAATYAEKEGHGEIALWLRQYPSLSTNGE